MSNPLRLQPLPSLAQALLEQHSASPRLIAHLTLTHDVAARLVTGIRKRWPHLPLDAEAVRFGAAAHDLGKVTYPEELRQPGNRHEIAGEQLLLAAGIRPELARFCRTHGQWRDESPLEDLLVALADKVWKGKRDEPLEQAILAQITRRTGEEPWTVFLALDDLLAQLAAGAEERLSWQRSHPVVWTTP